MHLDIHESLFIWSINNLCYKTQYWRLPSFLPLEIPLMNFHFLLPLRSCLILFLVLPTALHLPVSPHALSRFLISIGTLFFASSPLMIPLSASLHLVFPLADEHMNTRLSSPLPAAASLSPCCFSSAHRQFSHKADWIHSLFPPFFPSLFSALA